MGFWEGPCRAADSSGSGPRDSPALGPHLLGAQPVRVQLAGAPAVDAGIVAPDLGSTLSADEHFVIKAEVSDAVLDALEAVEALVRAEFSRDSGSERTDGEKARDSVGRCIAGMATFWLTAAP